MSTASTVEREMLALINQERTSRGLDPLQLETQLNDSSEDHSAWMLDTDRFSHTGAGGSSATQRMQAAGFDLEGSWRTGENIAWQSERGAPGISDDVAQLHENLMNSPGHRANILNPDFRYIGIGIEEGDMQGYDAVMVTQNFATTSADVMLDTGEEVTPPVDEEVAEPVEDVDDPVDEDVVEPVEDTDDPVDEDVAEPVEDTDEPVDEDVAEPEQPDFQDFDVAAFLAEIQAFVNALQARFDQFDWNTPALQPDEFEFTFRFDNDDDDDIVAEADVVEDTTNEFNCATVFETTWAFDFG